MGLGSLACVAALMLVDASDARLGLKLASLEFDPLDPPSHSTSIKTGIFFDRLLNIDLTKHAWEAEFWTSFEWYDPRNYSDLFIDPMLVNTEEVSCDNSLSSGVKSLGVAANDSSVSAAGSQTRFIELGADEIKLLWTPDIIITNLYGKGAVHSEFMRIYEDGHVELNRFLLTELDIFEKVQLSYPYDTLRLKILLSSRGYTTSRISFTDHSKMNGVNSQKLDDWDIGWEYVGHEHQHAHLVQPAYTLGENCRNDRFAEMSFTLDVRRDSAADLSGRLQLLPFDPLLPPAHRTEVRVGIYFDMLRYVDDAQHTFDADFYTVYMWNDPRNYSILFLDDQLVDVQSDFNSTEAVRQLVSRRLGEQPGSTEADTLQAPEADCSTQGHNVRFVEFGRDETKSIWTPDLEITNRQAGNNNLVHSMIMRLYEIGVIEVVVFSFARLEMQNPSYVGFPFDHKELDIIVESKSHSNKRIEIAEYVSMTGVEEGLLADWFPGWQYVGTSSSVSSPIPEYARANPCRLERRDRFTFRLKIRREWQRLAEEAILPTVLLVAVSFIAFAIDVEGFAAKVGVGFTTFLILYSWEGDMASQFQSQDSLVWFLAFFKLCRYACFCTLAEGGAIGYIARQVSLRFGVYVDRAASRLMPSVFILTLLLAFAVPKTHEGVLLISQLAYVLIAVDVLGLLIMGRFLWRQLTSRLTSDPLKVFHEDGNFDLDEHERRLVYSSLDGNGDESLSIDEIVRVVVTSRVGYDRTFWNTIRGHSQLNEDAYNAAVQKRTSAKDSLKRLLRAEAGVKELTRDNFAELHAAMFSIALHWVVHMNRNAEVEEIESTVVAMPRRMSSTVRLLRTDEYSPKAAAKQKQELEKTQEKKQDGGSMLLVV